MTFASLQKRGGQELYSHAGMMRHPHEPARQVELADHRCKLHPDARQAGEAAERDGGDEVFRLGTKERPEDGGRARLRPAAAAACRPDRGRGENTDKGRVREAAVELSVPKTAID